MAVKTKTTSKTKKGWTLRKRNDQTFLYRNKVETRARIEAWQKECLWMAALSDLMLEIIDKDGAK